MTPIRVDRSPGAGKVQARSDSEQLAEILQAEGIVDVHMLERAQAIHQAQGRWLGSVLVELGAISPEDMAQAISKSLGLRLLELTKAAANLDAIRALPESMARRFAVVPVSQVDTTLHLAMVNPLDGLACDLIQARTGMHLERMVATERDVRTAIDRFYGQPLPGAEGARGRRGSPYQPRDRDLGRGGGGGDACGRPPPAGDETARLRSSPGRGHCSHAPH